jgi:hypothetical protein
MLIQNKTRLFQVCEGVQVRPFRTAVVADTAKVDLSVFTILNETKKELKKGKGD